MKINFSPPDISQLEIDEVVDTLRSGWITTGPKTKRLEQELAQFVGTSRVVCMNSATIAMEMVLRFLGIGPGDEVITSAYTYSASASVIHHVGAKIVMADTAKDTFFIDPEDVRRKITNRTKAIIPVNLGGVMTDNSALIELCEEYRSVFTTANDRQKQLGRIVVLADAAHSLGAVRNGLRSGQDADFSCYSFHAVKNFTTAEGGAITWRQEGGWNDEEVYREFMLLALHGQNRDALAKTKGGDWEYDIIYPGYKGNMTDIMASLGLAQLKRYPELLERRAQMIHRYDERLTQLPYLRPLKHYDDTSRSSGHLYLVNLLGFPVEARNEVIERMSERDIAVNVHYKPLPMMTAYKNLGFDIADYPNAYHMYENEVTLPLHTLLTDEQVEYLLDQFIEVCELVRKEHRIDYETI